MSSHGSHGRRDNEEGKGPGISPSRRQARSESSQNPNSDRNVAKTQNHETMVPKSGSVGGSYIDDGQDFKSPNNASSKSYSKTATGQPAKNSAVPIDAITTYGSAIDDRGAFPDVQARAERRELGNKPRISKAEGNKSTPAEVPSKTTAPVKIPKKESAPAEHPSKDVSPLIVLKRKTTPEDTPKHQITTRDAALQTIRRTLNEYQSIIPIKNPRAQSNPPGEPEVKKEKKVLPPTSHSTYVVKDKQRGKAYVVSPPNIRKPGTSKEKSDSARGERKVNIKDRVLPPVKEETDSAVRKFNGQSESGKKPKKEQKSADRSQEPKKDQSSKPSASGKMEHKSTSAQPAHGSRQQKSSNPPQTQNKPSSTQAQRESRPKKEGQFMMSGALVKNKAATPNPTLPPTTPKQLKKCYKGYDIIDATEGTATGEISLSRKRLQIFGNQNPQNAP
ncbi:hypothetical protein M501DRAFT_989899 [Patellaria atrata CBS 101060]|uniref:Uncharacterized protein n=1 Tax=Patellaria atrata CBS 101060 TaxID=1346257 RepID=A0A9P4VTX4_9PEZI|nr:hypothetical protein M501DRAFT_989899 [Patellaria atrata CBS 101060]